jgi:hypothetical protein
MEAATCDSIHASASRSRLCVNEPFQPRQTAERVLNHVDTELAAKDLLNSRMAYVAVSRGVEDAQLYTNDRAKLPEALGHDVHNESAHTPAIKPEQAITPPQPEIALVIEYGFGMGHSL